MRKLYDLARGVAELEVSGAQPERILNYCAENGIRVLERKPMPGFFDHLLRTCILCR